MRTEREQLWHRLNERFVTAFATYHLLEDGDHVLVGLSGGKDSLCLLELLAKRARISHPSFKVEAIHVRMENIDYQTSTDYLESFCRNLDVPLHVVTTRFEAVGHASLRADAEAVGHASLRAKPPCFICSWNRRKQLFNLAQQLGCNKIALGHHQDDLLHTSLMNLFFQSRYGTMPARLQMKKMPLQIIRPLCMIEERDIARYAELAGYERQLKHCPYEHDTRRTDIRRLFEEAERLNPEVRHSLWSALVRENKLIE
jgi:tRNA(Ile)-lysidine synthase TilS/MesJ